MVLHVCCKLMPVLWVSAVRVWNLLPLSSWSGAHWPPPYNSNRRGSFYLVLSTFLTMGRFPFVDFVMVGSTKVFEVLRQEQLHELLSALSVWSKLHV
jgi:hypothetical protein